MCPKVIIGTDFRKRLQSIIWNRCLDPEFFEQRWTSLIEEFKLEDNKWLKEMFNIRNRWIPAFFKKIQLSGLMRTTSLSESQNFFFQNFLNKNSNLLVFMMKFDAAMDKQRNKQGSNDYNSVISKPSIITRVPFEIQAANHYTLKIFRIVQDEIYDSVWTCAPAPGFLTSENGNELCIVIEHAFGDITKGRSSFLSWKSTDENLRTNKEFRYKVLDLTYRYVFKAIIYNLYVCILYVFI